MISTPRRPPARGGRGGALLVVLAALVLAVTASATIARLASTVKLRRQFAERIERADDVLRAAEAPIVHWLSSGSASVVLPPDQEFPGLEVLHHQLKGEGDKLILQIWAFDQCGMAPLSVGRSGSPLRLALSQPVLSAIDGLELAPGQQAGLDLVANALDKDSGWKVFPQCPASEAVQFGNRERIELDKNAAEHSLAIGALVSTHCPEATTNVNTAPIPLIEAAMRTAAIGGIEQVIASRAAGRLAQAPAHQSRDGKLESGRVRLVSTSSAWSFRIDIHVGPLRRCWWAVYTQGNSEWECVQRLAITE